MLSASTPSDPPEYLGRRGRFTLSRALQCATGFLDWFSAVPIPRTVWITVVLFAVATLAIAWMSGCAIGRELDTGEPMVGLRPTAAGEAAAKGLGATLGGLVAGPPGAAAGTALAGWIFGAWRGERKGWDEHARERGAQPPLAGGAHPVPAPASPQAT